jgi:uncharacterized protein (DUF1499 family)
MIEFESLKLSWKPNQYLMAPDGLCRAAKPNRISPEFDLPVRALHDAFLAVARRQPRTVVEEEGPQGERFVQRSRVFKFPDDVDAQFIDLGENRSTLALYSRARMGVRDFGVNQARVTSWMEQLEADLKSA